MDSLLPSTVANILLEDLEMPSVGPRIGLRYVDNIIALWPHGDQMKSTVLVLPAYSNRVRNHVNVSTRCYGLLQGESGS